MSDARARDDAADDARAASSTTKPTNATEFFANLRESSNESARYELEEVIGKGSYGVVCAAIDRQTGTGSR
jgi:serine/threonine protein kinase